MTMRTGWIGLLLLVAGLPARVYAQGTVPVFQRAIHERTYTMLGRGPDQGSATIPVVLVPIRLSLEARMTEAGPAVMDAAPEVPRVLRSPVFSRFAFQRGGVTQYADALLRTTFAGPEGWHTLLGRPEVKPVSITVPLGFGYVLTSKKSGRSLAVVDVEFLQRELFRQVPRQDGKLVMAVTHNTVFYADGDATVCCTWGTHGVDPATQNSFVLGSYIRDAPAVVEDEDVQPLTQQLAEFVDDPLHTPLIHGRRMVDKGNRFPAWARPASMASGDEGPCGGTGVGTMYFLLEPTDTNPKNNIPSSKAFIARADGVAWHLQNAALLPWYAGAAEGLGKTFSFPDSQILTEAAKPCRPSRRHEATMPPTAAAVPSSGAPNGHWLIGYWEGYGSASSTIPLRDIAPQWDVVIVAFASPDHKAPEGTMRFQPPRGLAPEQFKADIGWLKSHGRKVMVSLGGGGEFFTLVHPESVANFVSSVGSIVSDYGFDGVDIDFESPSLVIDAGDTDFRHPTTPSIVNLIAGLRQLHDRFGPRFMISLVPEGTQIPGGYPSYGGQFGTYLPLTHALRNILSFVDVQDYNTPPLEGLDGEIYQAGTVDYHAAMTELLLHGFDVGGDRHSFFEPLPADKVAVGFLTGDATPAVVGQAMRYIITGERPAGATYRLRNPGGYPGMIGAMFWTINDDQRLGYRFSNTVGPQLHSYPTAR